MYSQIAANKRKSALLIIIFIILMLAIGYFIGEYYNFGYWGILVAAIYSFVISLLSYYSGDKVALFTSGAKGPIKKEDNPYVWRLVENLCITAGLKMPKIYIIPEQGMNAFATGRDPEHASIALTEGLIQNLENEELEGVIAHELSHIKNYDIRLMTIVIVMVGIITLLADFFIRFSFSRNRDRKSGPLALIGLILIILSPIFAKLIQLAISRKREFLADASGALLTRYPQGLASALKKISQHPSISTASKATAHLFIASPFKKSSALGKTLSKFLSTHPPIEERIKALEQMA